MTTYHSISHCNMSVNSRVIAIYVTATPSLPQLTCNKRALRLADNRRGTPIGLIATSAHNHSRHIIVIAITTTF